MKTKSACLFILASALVSLASSCAEAPAKENIYVAWSNKQDSYSFISTIKTIEAIGCNPVVLNMVRSTDLEYREDNSLADCVDEHGILLS